VLREFFAGFAVVALAGCRGGADSEVVPWLPTSPPAAESPKVALAPPCRATELHGRLGLQGAGGSLYGGIVLRHVGTEPCSLVGRPRARLVGKAAEETRWRVRAMKALPPGEDDDDALVAPLASLRSLHAHERVWLGLAWSNWCPPGSKPTASAGPIPKALLLELRSGDELSFRLRQAPNCGGPAFPSSLGIAPFRPREREPARSTRIPLRASFDGIAHPEVKFRTPELRAPRGGVLRYRIALTNRSAHPFAFDECPVYEQNAFTLHYRESYVLNCKEVGTFAPGERKVFAMELHVPAKTRLGRNSLTWKLGPKTYEPPWVPATILITP
jgi:hypothetical protein